VVNQIQRLVRPAKVGHAGTLDPLATGVLVVCVGQATRLVEYIQRQHKEYDATFLLGRFSDTDDVEGEVHLADDMVVPRSDNIQAAIGRFVGAIEQRPPAYSAVKIQGKRAHSLARQGAEVDLPARTVRVDTISILDYEHPSLRLRIRCGSGTYIRSLGRDLARAVGTCAVMSELCRTAIGSFRRQDAIPPHALDAQNIRRSLLPLSMAVESMSRVDVSTDDARRLASGQFIKAPSGYDADETAVFADGQFVAVASVDTGGHLRPLKNFTL